MNRKDIIEQKLSVLNPHLLDVIDQSTNHAGHTGNPGGEDGTHFTIQISSKKFDGLKKIEQHRMINELLHEEFDKGLHALSIKIVS